METKAVKKLTSFRIDESLLNRLKVEARRTNRSLNNYVEYILMNSIYNEPNETTLLAIEEARNGKSAGIIDTSSMDNFIKSCE